MRQNSCGTVDIVKANYDPRISKVPELIGKHPGVIAPVTLAKVNPLEIVRPASASRSGAPPAPPLRPRPSARGGVGPRPERPRAALAARSAPRPRV